MTIDTAIYSRLTSHAGVSGLVSNRVYPSMLPQNVVFPAIVYQVISGARESNFGADTGNVRHRVQVTVFGEKKGGQKAVLDILEQVRFALQRYSDSDIDDVYVEGESRDYDDDLKIHIARMDFMIWYKE